jgi:Flp pilus assembly protein TadD
MLGKELYQQGLLLQDAGKFSEALTFFNKALDLEPANPNYLSDRAVTYFHLNKKDLAIIDLNHAQKLDPNNPYRYSSRAFVKDSLGDLAGAIKDYEKCIELDPDDAVAHNNLGLLEEKYGYKQKAERRFKKADELMDGKKENIPPADKFINMTESSKNEKSQIQHNATDKIKNKELEKVNSKEKTKWGHMKNALFTKTGRKEFFKFIKNGFKLK